MDRKYRLHLWLCGALAVFGLILYGQTLHYEFVYDDDSFVVLNQAIRDLRNTPAFFTEPGTLASDQQLAHDNYRPLVTLSFAVNYALGKLDPFGYRLFNLLLHILNTLLVFWLGLRIFKREWPAFIAAAIFLAHPVQVESVVFVSSRSNLLSLAFMLGSFLIYVNRRGGVPSPPAGRSISRDCGQAQWPAPTMSILLFACALLSKEMVIVLPAIIILWEGLFGVGWKRGVRNSVPYFLVAGASFTLRTTMLGRLGQSDYWGGDLYHTMLTMARGFAAYVRLVVWPHPLSIEYLFDVSRSIGDRRVIGSCVLLLSLLGLSLWNYRRRPVLSFGILFFFIGLSPVSNIIPVKAVINERFMYLSVIGFALAAAELIRLAVLLFSSSPVEDQTGAPEHRSTDQPRALYPVFGLLFVYSLMTMARAQDWRTGLSLVVANLKTAPQSARLHYGFGRQYASRGEFGHAAREFELCLMIDPSYDEASRDLARIHAKNGDLEATIASYRQTLQTRVQVPETLFELGTTYLKGGRPAEAIVNLEAAVKAKPNPEWKGNLAAAYAADGQLDKAIALAQDLLAKDSGLDKVQRNLERWRQEMGRGKGARRKEETTFHPSPLSPHRSIVPFVRAQFPDAAPLLDRASGSRFTSLPHGMTLKESGTGSAPAMAALTSRYGLAPDPEFLFPKEYGTVGLQLTGEYQIKEIPLDAAASPAAVEDGVIVYKNAYPNVDVLYAVNSGEMEKMYFVRRKKLNRFRFKLEGNQNVGSFQMEKGSLQVISKRTRQAVLELTPPVVIDSKGRKIAAQFDLDETILTLSFNDQGLTYPLLVDPTWRTAGAGTMSSVRSYQGAVVLPNGKVLVVSGVMSGPLASTCELYDPAAGTWVTTGGVASSRAYVQAVLLANGKVLIAGGTDGGSGQYSTSELYDPAVGTWSTTGAMKSARYWHSMTLLPNGQVLVTGGKTAAALSTAELYDPGLGTWSTTNSLASTRSQHTATLLPNGQVLVMGGQGASVLSTVEMYNPSNGTWTTTGSMLTTRYQFVSTLLPNGKVLASSGHTGVFYSSSTETYDPSAGTWSAAANLLSARTTPVSMLLPNGKVIVAGGGGPPTWTSTAELYDPTANTWTTLASLASARTTMPGILLPSGKLMIIGGTTTSGVTTSNVEIYDPGGGSWAGAGTMGFAREEHTATLLPSGKVLITGGDNGSNAIANVELYDPVLNAWSTTASMASPREDHTSTLLPSGKVLIAGGFNGGALSTAELYDPTSSSWTTISPMNSARYIQTATLLANGKVMMAGGNNGAVLKTVEVYDPLAGTWTTTQAMSTTREEHTATPLPNGKILVTGGFDGTNAYASAELYDPSVGTWSATNAMNTVRIFHTATMLPSGKVMIAGGQTAGGATCPTVELYDPNGGTWATTNAMLTGRFEHTTTLLPGGKVMAVAGKNGVLAMSTVELYDVAAGSWTALNPVNTARDFHTATLLNNGNVFITGGLPGPKQTAEMIYYSEYQPDSTWVPLITSVPRAFDRGQTITMTGSRFKGVSEGSGGNFGQNNTPSNAPRVYLQGMDSGNYGTTAATDRLLDISTYVYANAGNSWSSMDTSLTFAVPSDSATLPYGWYQMRVISNGMASNSYPVEVVDISGKSLPRQPYVYSTTHMEGVTSTSTYIVFVATGSADHYHYLFNAVASSSPAAGDTQWDGSTLSTTTTSGTWYMHVMGRNGSHSGGETNDGYANFGPIVISTTPPPAVSTMTATASTTTTSITLAWATPSDPSSITAYRIQYNIAPNPPWDSSAYNVRFTTSGMTAGMMASYTVGGLTTGTSYYFALWSENSIGLLSPISNIPVAITTNVYTAIPIAKNGSDTTTDSLADIQSNDIVSFTDVAVSAGDKQYTVVAAAVVALDSHTVTGMPDEPLTSVTMIGRYNSNTTGGGNPIQISTSGWVTSRNVYTPLNTQTDTTFNVGISTTAGTRSQISRTLVKFTNSSGGNATQHRMQIDYIWIQAVVQSSAPAAVTNLAVSTYSATSATITWSAQGDDGTLGSITGGKYRIKAATYTPYNYDVSDWTDQWSTTTSPGTSESRGETGLTPNTTYYFRVWTADEQPLFGAISNGATQQTFAAVPAVPASPFTVFQTSVTVSWLDNSNPSYTEYQIQASTASNFTGTLLGPSTTYTGWLVGTSTTVISLAGGTTYYFQVKARNTNLNQTTFISLGSTQTTAAYVTCGALTSVANSSWSLTSTWDAGVVPSSCTAVTIAAGTTVTLDISTATASTTTVNGILRASRVNSSTFTLVGGNLTVAAGGTLDLGSSGSQLSASSATLILASGSTAGQYGLTVNDGGNFLVYGSTKTPATTATGGDVGPGSAAFTVADATGWGIGDVITVDTEAITITNITGTTINTFSPSLGSKHYSTNTVRVNDLSHNVLVRSSGTNTSTNTAYIRNLVHNTTGFYLVYGEFAYLGTGTFPHTGVHFDGNFGGAAGTVSSCTFRNGYKGLAIQNASNSTVASSLFYANADGGIYLTGASNNSLISNQLYANAVDAGIYLSGPAPNNTIRSNVGYANTTKGFDIVADSNTLFSNTATNNTNVGIQIAGSGNLSISNSAYNNPADGMWFNSGAFNNISIGDIVYANGNNGLWTGNASLGNQYVEGKLGYTASNASSPNGVADFLLATTGNNATFKKMRVNPSPGAPVAGFLSGNYLVSFDQDSGAGVDTGTVRVYGDYTVSGSTLNLDYSANTYASSATPPKLMRGVGGSHSAIINSTSDSNAVSQYVTITYSGGAWSVVGSVSGILCNPAPGAPTDCSNPAQFNLTVTNSGTPADGDFLDFALIAASSDTNRQKKLLFGTGASGFNNGRSKIKVAPAAGFHTVGTASNPTLVTMLTGSTYYTFVDSGAFFVQYASFTFMDESGVQLSSAGVSGPWSINNSTFDYVGKGIASTSTLITLNGMTQSTITLTDVTYGNSLTNTTNYNYTFVGSSVGLQWNNYSYSGALTGDPKERSDTGNHVTWNGAYCSTITSVVNGNWSSASTWDVGLVPTSCNPVYVVSGATVTLDAIAQASTITITGTLKYARTGNNQLTQVGGNLYVNPGGTLDLGTQASPIPAGTTAYLILSSGTTAGQYGLIVNNGGNFLVYGSTKTPSTTYTGATAITPATNNITVADATGWQNGDLVTIDTEPVTISGISGNTFNITPVTITHSTTSIIRVNDLTRNVVVRSSGTNTSTNTAYIQSLVLNAAGFVLNYGEFAYLGANVLHKYGINFDATGVIGSISSSTVRDGYIGINGAGASSNTFTSNLIYRNGTGLSFDLVSSATLTSNSIYANSIGIYLSRTLRIQITSNKIYSNLTGISDTSNGGGCSNNTITLNTFYSNGPNGSGIDLRDCEVTVSSNVFYSNPGSSGIYCYGCSNNTFAGNNLYLNRNGFYMQNNSSGNTFLSNDAYSNDGAGLAGDNSGFSNNLLISNLWHFNNYSAVSVAGVTLSQSNNNNTFISDSMYSNAAAGLYVFQSTGVMVVNCNIGYSSAAVALANTGTQVNLDHSASGPSQLVLKNTPVNPATTAIGVSYLDQPGGYILNFTTTTGLVQLYGDYTVSGSTFSLDYANQLYSSTATTPKTMRGSGWTTLRVDTTTDANAVSQLITVTWNGSAYDVVGSSSGALGSYGSLSNQAVGSPVQFNLTATGSPAATDVFDFGLVAASKDQTVQKKLQFGPSATSGSTWNSNTGRSKISIAPGSGLSAQGTQAFPTLIDMLPGSGTYYTFVDSGALTVQYSSFTNMDESGLQLTGTAGVSMSSSTFDFAGESLSSTNTYITANSLTSASTFYGMTFNASRSSGTYRYNVWASTEANLSWFFSGWSGARGGEAFDKEDGSLDKVTWLTAGYVACSTLTSVANSSWSLTSTWDFNVVPSSCSPVVIAAGTTVTLDISAATASTTTVNGILRASRVNSSTFTLVGGNLTVSAGGTLDLGTSGSPINASSATLILASGTVAGQYGLIVNNGGNFLVYGAAKTPWSTVPGAGTVGGGVTSFSVSDATGWQAGDLITIDTEAVRIAAGGISGNTISNYSPGLGQVHYATFPVVVANLTRNVVVRSSGTDTSANTAYIQNLAANATSFNVNYGEFAYLGADVNTKRGIDFESAKGSISSSTIRNGRVGIWLAGSNSTLAANLIYANVEPANGDGIDVIGNNNIISSNISYANSDGGIFVQGNNNTLIGNYTFYNLDTFAAAGIYLNGAANNLLVSNNAYTNGLVGNPDLGNGVFGIAFNAGCSNNTLIADNLYSNRTSGIGLLFGASAGSVCVDCHLGYTGGSAAAPDGGASEIGSDNSSIANLVLKNSLVNPSPGISMTSFSQPGDYIVNFTTTPGIVQMYGDYAVSGSTFTLDYASRLYFSTATTPAVMVGAESASGFVVSALSDANALSQLITITASGSNWIVTGSSTTGTLCTIAGGSNADCGSLVQFHLAVPAVGATGDIANFALIAASNDLNSQKKLQFGTSGLNNGRAKISIASGSGFHAVGQSASANPTLIDWISSGSTYYTFVSSGAFAVQYASFTHMDESGIQLSSAGASGPWSINYSTFDYAGKGIASTSTLITLNGVTQSTITLVANTYGSNLTNTTNYNYTILGSSAGLSWTNIVYSGGWAGDAHERADTQNHIKWGVTNTCQVVTNLTDGLWSASTTWNTGFIPTTCNAVVIATGTTVTLDTSSATAAATTINGTLASSRSTSSTMTLVAGNMTVTAGGTLDFGSSGSPMNASSATLILAYGASAAQYGLTINNGGNLLVYGAAKTPDTTATGGDVGPGSAAFTVTDTAGWRNGDLILVDTEAVTITNLSGTTINTYSPNLVFKHYSSNTVRVANLSRNVVIRSSGTSISANSAYIQNLAQNTTSFNVNYGEFAFLGKSGCGTFDCGITFNGSAVRGTISSSTIRYSQDPIYLNGSNFGIFTGNVIFGGNIAGIYITGSNNIVTNNAVVGNFDGMDLNAGSGNNLISFNDCYQNTNTGSYLFTSSSNAFISNNYVSNGNNGLYFDKGSSANLLASNNFYSNRKSGGAGVYFNTNTGVPSNNNTGIDNHTYGNLYGVYNVGTAGNTWVGGSMGYTGAGTATADTTTEIFFSGTTNLTMKYTRVNPSPGLDTSGIGNGNYLLSYNQDFATGTVKLYGNYTVTGSTFTLDYATNSYSATATPPISILGASTAVLISTSDDNAVSQAITMTYNGTNWTVVGSSSGSMGTISGGSNQNLPTSGATQCVVNITESAPVAGDTIVFGLIGSGQDDFVQKKLNFGSTTSGYNSGKSRMIVATGGFHAVGISSAPTIIDIISGATYYNFVSSAPLTLGWVNVNNTDQNGLWVSSATIIAIDSTTFDNAMAFASTAAYITVSTQTNAQTMTNVAFNNTPNRAALFNIKTSAVAGGWTWTMNNYSGVRSSATYESDPNNHIIWGANITCSTRTSVVTGVWSDSSTWDVGQVPTSCNPVLIVAGTTVTVDSGGTTASTTTINGTLYFSRTVSSTFTVVGGTVTVNAGGTLNMGTASDPIASSSATLILSSGTFAGQYGLTINNGGNVVVYGATKTPATTESSGANLNGGTTQLQLAITPTGWSAGDLITVDTEPVTINAISGNTITSFSPSLTLTHYSTTTVRVADLTRNVLVRSSGTNTSTNTSYIQNLVQNATSFNLNYGEFAYLGTSSGASSGGISFNGAGVLGSISSCTIRNGYFGIYMNLAGGIVLLSNNVYSNVLYGFNLLSSNANTISLNNVYGNGSHGFFLFGNNNLVSANNFYSNIGQGIFGAQNAVGNNIVSNNVYSNGSHGMHIDDNNNTLTTNMVYSNGIHGLWLGNTALGSLRTNFTLTSNRIYSNNGYGVFLDWVSSVTLNSNFIYSNADVGLLVSRSTGVLSTNDSFGYNASLSLSPDTTAEIFISSTVAASTVTLYGAQVNPSIGISTVGFSQSGTYLISYNQNFATGTVNVYGDYTVSGSTLTLDYASALYLGSGDANRQKQLLFGPSAPTFNSGRSKITINGSGGFHAVGISSAPTILDMISGATYYSFVSSGALTLGWASINNTDQNGLYVSSATTIAIDSTTFDNAIAFASSATYITVSTQTNAQTLTNVAFNNTPNRAALFNIKTSAVAGGWTWTMNNYSGVRSSATYESDPNNHIIWGANITCSTRTSVVTGVWSDSSTWDVGQVPTSCNPVLIVAGTTVTVDSGGAVASTTTINGTLTLSRVVSSTLTLVGGNVIVNAGGTLDLGTSGSPINASTATLILASGTVAGQYGLIVNVGGNFLVYGNPTNPGTSKSVLVRSSGTDTAANTDYIQNLTQSTGSFNVNFGEFAYLGANVTSKWGLTMDNSSRGIISSCTIRNGYWGIVSEAASNNSIVGNTFFSNAKDGLWVGDNSNNNMISGNQSYSNTGSGIYLFNCFGNTVSSNTVYSAGVHGLALNAASSNTVVSNTCYSNLTGYGLVLFQASNNSVVSNTIYSNGVDGLRIESSAHNNTLVANTVYNNVYGLELLNSSGTVWVGGILGYDGTGSPSANTSKEILIDNTSNSNLTLKGARVNPSNGIDLTGLNGASRYLVSYNQDFGTGTVKVYGDYTVSASTLTLDYSSNTWSSYATPPKLMRGTGGVHTSSVTTTFDANAISQLITITYNGSNWIVTGSSTPGTICSITGTSGTSDCPNSASKQFNLTVNGATPAIGDFLDFSLIGASSDTSRQKQLQFGVSAAGFNNGRSKITLNSTGGMVLKGKTDGTSNTLMDMLSGSTYYTFVDSGALTLSYATVQNVDEKGLQLTGAQGVALASSTFDFAGVGLSSTNTYITANSLTSASTFYGMTFNNSRSSGTFRYNVWASTEAGLSWFFSGWSGARGGASFDKEDGPLNNVTWTAVTTPNTCQLVTSVANSSWSLTTTWDTGFVPTSCNPVAIAAATSVTLDISTATASTTTVNGTLRASRVASSTFSLVGGNLTISDGGTIDLGTSGSPLTLSSVTVILATGSVAGQYGLIVSTAGNFVAYGNSANGLSKNVVIRSSGTNTGSNTAYVRNFTNATTSFSATYAEFAYLGENSGQAGKFGITFDGSLVRGSISSSTIHDGYTGVYLNGTSSITLNANNVYSNASVGLYLNSASSTTLSANNVYSNSTYGISISNAQNNIFFGNTIYSNTSHGLEVSGARNSFISNTVYSNGVYGFDVNSSSNTFVGNNVYSNAFIGFSLNSASNNLFASNLTYSHTGQYGMDLSNSKNNVFISHYSYSNGYGIRSNLGSIGDLFVGGGLGYAANGSAAANTTADAYVHWAGLATLTLKYTLINVAGINTSGLTNAGSYMVNYSTTPGVVQIYGDYSVSGSTLTLDYAANIYGSTATTPKLMWGAGHSAAVNSTNDTYAVSQIIFANYQTSDGKWHVTGSSETNSEFCSMFSNIATNCVSPGTGNVEFNLTVATVSTPSNGDRLDFALIAASNDVGQQKKLQFGATTGGFNNNRSKITIPAGLGFHAVGQSVTANPTLIDMMSTGGTYYSFVDSGTFTIQYATITNTDENGIWLNGSGGISMADSVFNYMGKGVSTSSTYITCNTLTSTATFQNLEFDNARLNTFSYNTQIIGSDASLYWTMQNYSGPLAGEYYELNDPNDKILWGFHEQSGGIWHIMD